MSKTLKVTPSPEWEIPGARAHKRVDLHASLVWRPVDMAFGHEVAFRPGEVLDISAGGMKFAAHAILRKGDRIQVRVSIAEILAKDEDTDPANILDKVDLEVQAQVRQDDKRPDGTYIYGLQFENVIAGDIDVLAAFIEKFA